MHGRPHNKSDANFLAWKLLLLHSGIEIFTSNSAVLSPRTSASIFWWCSRTSQGWNLTHSGFYRQCGTIGHNEVLFLSVSFGGSWLQMLHSLSPPIIFCLIEDNITRQWGLAHHSASMARAMERAGLLKVGWSWWEGVCVCACVYLSVLGLG